MLNRWARAVCRPLPANKRLELGYKERELLYGMVNKVIEEATRTNNIILLNSTYNFMLAIFNGGYDNENKLIGQAISNCKSNNYLE